MQRKPGYPVANSSIKMPDSAPASEVLEDEEPSYRRQHLINFGHTQWGFNNWSWAVSKQELDFVDLICGKYSVGVVAFVSISLKTLDIHRENIGYATAVASTKGSAIHRARKSAVTNALRETLLSFGGAVASELLEMDGRKSELSASDLLPENSPSVANKPPPPQQLTSEPKNSPHNKNIRKDSESNGTAVVRAPVLPPAVKNVNNAPPPVAKAHPMPVNLPPAANRPQPPAAPRPLQPPAVGAPLHSAAPLVAPPPAAHAPPHPRPNSNVSFVVPMMGSVVPPVYGPPRLAPHHAPHLFPNAYYEYAGPWHFSYDPYERPHGNVNLNFNIPPKNLVVNGRASNAECKNACGRDVEAGQFASNRGCWIKPSIFYDGFWTEQKVKKWVAEQVEKQFPPEQAPTEPPAPKL